MFMTLQKFSQGLTIVSLNRVLYRAFGYGVTLLLLILPVQGFSANNASPEYQLKAALLYKLTKFVNWPVAQNNSTSKAFGLCVLGENYFGKTLNSLEERKVNNRSIKVLYLDQSDAIHDNCDLVFISDSKKAFLNPILNTLSTQPVLTVGDIDNFAEQGGMIQFTVEGKRIGFKINDKEAKRSNLNIAAQLLQLATIVDSEK